MGPYPKGSGPTKIILKMDHFQLAGSLDEYLPHTVYELKCFTVHVHFLHCPSHIYSTFIHLDAQIKNDKLCVDLYERVVAGLLREILEFPFYLRIKLRIYKLLFIAIFKMIL